jgi:hypothetical protein
MKIALEIARNQSKKTDGIFLGATTLSIMALSTNDTQHKGHICDTQLNKHSVHKALLK